MSAADKKAGETARFLDNLTSFLAGEDRETSDILESLRAHGVNPEQSLREFREILSEHASTWREKAARARSLVAASLRSGQERVRRSRSEIEGEIRQIVESMKSLGAPVEVGAFYRKFQETREEDLDSLLEDLELQRALFLKQREKADSDG